MSKSSVFLGVVVLLCQSAGAAGAAEAWVWMADNYWCPVAGDSLSGAALGCREYSLGYHSTGATPIPGPAVCFSAAPQVGLYWADYACQQPFYGSLRANGANWSSCSGFQGGWWDAWMGRTPGSVIVDTGMTITRSVPDPVLTDTVQTQTVTLDLTLDRPLDAEANFINVGLAAWDVDYLEYDVVSCSAPAPFAGGGGWFHANPVGLAVGQPYHFEAVVEVQREGPFVGGSLYHKPPVIVEYGKGQGLSPVVSDSVVLTLESGAEATFRASEDVSFSGSLNHEQVDLHFSSAAARVGPPRPQQIFLDRGSDMTGAGVIHWLDVDLEGENIRAVELTTPGGRTIPLREDDGSWSYEIDAIDPDDLSEYAAGSYAFAVYGTDGSGPLITEVVLPDGPPPSEFPVITGPGTVTVDHTPRITWQAPEGPDVDLVYVGCEGGDEDVIEALVEPETTSLEVIDSLSRGSYVAEVAFLNGASGLTAEGIEYVTGWWTGTARVFNIVAAPLGDANGDGKVDYVDLGLLATNYGQCCATWQEGDFNIDGCVDYNDLGVLATNYGVGVPAAVPEPATVLLLLAGLAWVRRRPFVVTP